MKRTGHHAFLEKEGGDALYDCSRCGDGDSAIGIGSQTEQAAEPVQNALEIECGCEKQEHQVGNQIRNRTGGEMQLQRADVRVFAQKSGKQQNQRTASGNQRPELVFMHLHLKLPGNHIGILRGFVLMNLRFIRGLFVVHKRLIRLIRKGFV